LAELREDGFVHNFEAVLRDQLGDGRFNFGVDV
jgi:hypothetical protein